MLYIDVKCYIYMCVCVEHTVILKAFRQQLFSISCII